MSANVVSDYLAGWPRAASNISSPTAAPTSRRSSRPTPRGRKLGWRLPQIVIVPHENMGVAMAHGYAMVSGRAAGDDGARRRRHGELASTA